MNDLILFCIVLLTPWATKEFHRHDLIRRIGRVRHSVLQLPVCQRSLSRTGFQRCVQFSMVSVELFVASLMSEKGNENIGEYSFFCNKTEIKMYGLLRFYCVVKVQIENVAIICYQILKLDLFFVRACFIYLFVLLLGFAQLDILWTLNIQCCLRKSRKFCFTLLFARLVEVKFTKDILSSFLNIISRFVI